MKAEKQEKAAEKMKNFEKNSENGENFVGRRWTFCANELYLTNVPFAKRTAF